ncbi:ABC transporter permease [Streptomyces sp. NBRC 14336]|uniref:ABC transporter permease n=1 Tax=Streptomyces sp. NBRC 14336 TaxID=3030992 RepID=UPI0024A32216|nr:ABC transporter permease [Streptomyces sp. NBRC 14336]GLW50361.1 ABC transporter permease [Streptomyces sp. NBRC 14336]
MTELTGAVTLTRLVLRRDRVRILLWLLAVPVLVLVTAASIKGLYPTQHDLDVAAEASRDNAAAIAFNGPPLALDTMGGEVAFQVGTLGLVVVALMSVFMTGRNTRGEEEAGRGDALRALPVGRHANATATLLVVTAMNVAVGAAIALGLIAMDLPAKGSLVFGTAFCLLGLLFAAFTLVAAQISENTRVVHGGTGAVLGAAFVLRAVGDIGDGTLSWFSPIGLVQKSRPFAGERWWPLLLAAVGAAAAVAVAHALSDGRDVGAGLVPPRPGPPRAAPGLGRPLGLAVRLQRGSLIGWGSAVFLTGLAYGWVAADVEDFIGDNDTMADIMARYGATDLTDSYLAQSLLLVALIGTGFAVQSALRPLGEEGALRAEPLLATPVSRARWMASHLAVALAGSVVVLALAGLGAGIAYGSTGGGWSQIPRLTGAALAYAPALWLLAGLATALFGLLPRATAAAWAVLAACAVIGLLGEVLGLPSWVRDLSPFEHVPHLPAGDPTVAAPLLLALVAALLTAAGVAGFRRREVG